MHGAFLCYREQCLPLLRGEITNKSNIELNTVNQSSRLSVAVSAIFGMDFGVREVYVYLLKGPALPLCVHPQSDHLAGSQ